MDRSGERVALIERLDRDGRVRQVALVRAWPATVGRGFDNDLVVDDPHLAATHLHIAPDEEGTLRLHVHDDARNVVRLGAQRIGPGQSTALPRQAWSVGPVTLRVRWAGEPLEPERAWQPLPTDRLGAAAPLLLWAAVAFEIALALDPGAPATAWLPALLAVPVALSVWAGLWGFMSKLFRQRFEFWPHVGIAARWALASTVLRWVLPAAAFAFSLPWLIGVAVVLGVLLFFGLVRAHVLRVLPERSRAITLLMGAGALAFLGVQAVTRHQATDRWIAPLYLSQLGPPWLRVAPAIPAAQFVEEARALKPLLERNAAADLASRGEDAP